MAAKKRRSYTALVYFLTFAIFFAIIGGGAWLVLDRYILTHEEEETSSVTDEVLMPTKEDCVTTLFVLSNEQKDVSGILLARLMPTENALKLVPVPPSTAYGDSDFEATFKSGGVSSLITAIGTEYDVLIDKYMVLNDKGFIALADILGGTAYTIPCDMYYKDSQGNLTSFTQGLTDYNMTGEDLLKIIRYPLYEQGLSLNNKLVGDVVTELLNNACIQRTDIMTVAKTIYLNLFNSSDTNISAADWNEYEGWIRYILSNNQKPVMYKSPFGDWVESRFVPSYTGITDIKTYFAIG